MSPRRRGGDPDDRSRSYMKRSGWCTPEQRERLQQFTEPHASCFAAWAVPGHAILCERPANALVIDGRSVSCEWHVASEGNHA